MVITPTVAMRESVRSQRRRAGPALLDAAMIERAWVARTAGRAVERGLPAGGGALQQHGDGVGDDLTAHAGLEQQAVDLAVELGDGAVGMLAGHIGGVDLGDLAAGELGGFVDGSGVAGFVYDDAAGELSFWDGDSTLSTIADVGLGLMASDIDIIV